MRRTLLGYVGTLVIVALGLFGFAPSGYAAHTATLAWNADSGSSAVGYRVYYGSASASYDQFVDVGNSTTVALTGLHAGATYFAVVTAYGADGTESAPSDEITFVLAADAVPTVSLVNPGSSLNGPANVTLQASASVQDATITKVDFFAGASKLGTASAAPYSLAWNNVQPGHYNLVAVAYDSNGNSASSATVPVSVVSFGITSLVQSGDGGYQLMASGAPGSSYSVLISDDLVSWRVLTTVTNTSGTVSFHDATAAGVPRRFYRLVVNLLASPTLPVKAR